MTAVASAPARAADPTVVEVSVGDNMRFVPAAMEAKPGERLRVVLKAVGKIAALGHNFVLLKRGVDPRSLVEMASTATKETGSMPPAVSDRVIAASALARSGETAEVSFDAPAQPGEYVFVCTFPGHFNLGMKGLLTVK
jgi:azurin